MSYRIEGKDIVIDGFEKGIADTPYTGIADMRNIELLTVPGEAQVSNATAAATKPPVANAVAFTAQAAGNTITPTGGTTGYYQGVAIVLNTNSATGLSTGIVYYVHTITGTTFQLSLAPASTTPVDITVDGSGTFTTYQFPSASTSIPVSYFVDRNGNLAGSNAIWLTDNSSKVWVILSAAQVAVPANSLIFMGNIGGIAASGTNSTNGISVWNGYVLLFGNVTAGIDIADCGDLWVSDGPALAWDYGWENMSTQTQDNSIQTLNCQEDGNLYFTSTEGLGSIIETPGDVFDPSDTNSYTITDEALLLPETDESTCIAELGSNLLIGGRNSFVYVWNKIDPGFSGLLNIPDTYTTKIVATSANAYVFSGIRGRIYITNGSGIDLYRKIPDYITGVLNPFYRWKDASFGRNQLYFSFIATNSSGTTLTSVAGAWAIDLESEALRLVNKTSNTGYAGTVRMVTERPSASAGSPISSSAGIAGSNLAIGWSDGSSSGIDVSTAVPYTNYESFMELEMIPIGTYLDRFTPTQIEFKTSYPLGGGGTAETVRISYRENLMDDYTVIGTTTATGTSVVGSTTGTSIGYAVSDYYQASFQNIQWVQLKVELASNATTPTYNRLTEVRIRDWPSGANSK